jgi:hypothetical protein
MLLLAAAGCHAPFTHGRDSYREGMKALQFNPPQAQTRFQEAEIDMAEVLTDPELDTGRRVAATSIRIRSLIELGRHDDARALSGTPIPGFHTQGVYEGDMVGLSLLKIRSLDPERAYAELLLAERPAITLQSRLHLAREQVFTLKALGTAQAKAEAAKICQAYSGKLDFDQLKQGLSTP